MKRNYRDASAYGRMVRLLAEAKKWSRVAGTLVVLYIAVVLTMLSCEGCAGTAGNPGGESGVDVAGNGTDTTLGETKGDASKDGSGDSSTDSKDGADQKSGDVGADAAVTCPPPDRPNDVVPITLTDGTVECLESAGQKQWLGVELQKEWFDQASIGNPNNACASIKFTVLPSDFVPLDWQNNGGKPAKYMDKPVLRMKCVGFVGNIYFGLDSCNQKSCLFSAPDKKDTGEDSALAFSWEDNNSPRGDWIEHFISTGVETRHTVIYEK